MSKAAKSPEPVKTEELPFEDALKRLEGIVESMESGDLPLETLLARFEEGTKLADECRKHLEDAEGKIEILMRQRNGRIKTEAFDVKAGR